MNTKTENFLPVLEPLSKATSQTLQPLKLFDNDYLLISLDNEGRRFITECVVFNPVPFVQIWGQEFEAVPESEVREINEKRFIKSDRTPSMNATRWIRRLPERSQIGWSSCKYKVAGTDYSAIVMHHIWPEERLVFTEEAKLLYDYLLKRFLHQTGSANIVAKFKVDKQIPEMPYDFIEHDALPLMDFQKVALLTSLQQESSALFMEQGTGKTPIVINRICLEGARKRAGKLPSKNKNMYRALICCPNQVRLNWEAEFARFATTPGKTSVLRGGLLNRQKHLIDGIRNEDDCCWSACIMSIDSVNSTWEAIKRVPWDLVVIDESHYIKNPHSLRFKTMRKFNEPIFGARMILTGTPIANTLFDVWSQFEFLGDGLSGFMTFQNFRSFHGKYTNVETGRGSIAKLIGFKGIPMIQERLARLAYMITKKEANLNLPDKVYDIAEVKMTALQAEWYRKIASVLVIEMEEMLNDPKTMSVDHILTKLLRLAQITSGHVKWNAKLESLSGDMTPAHVEQIPGENPKVQAILEMITNPDRDPKGKTLVWCTFIEDIRVISKALSEAGISHVGYHRVVDSKYRVKDSQAAEERINLDSDCRVLIANPASGGTGHNYLGYDREHPERFSSYVDHEIFMSCNWSAVQRSQAEDRAHRRGTRNNVRITDLVVPGTIDEEIRARVLAKRQMALQIQDVREILRNLLSLNLDIEVNSE